MRVASIDVGSNSVLMLVADLEPKGSWRRVEDHAEVTRISRGLDQSGLLEEESIARTASVLRVFAERARALGVDRILATGTAPFRSASNGAQVAERLSEVIGAPLVVVSGETEAALTLEATLASFPGLDESYLVDIGGASTEIIECRHGATRSVSMDIGVVRLTERYVSSHPLDLDTCESIRAAVRTRLQASGITPHRGLPVIGVAGTVTTLAAVDLEMSTWDPDRIQGYRMACARVVELGASLSSLDLEARSSLPGLDPRRADVLPAGAWLLAEICAYLGSSEIWVSDRGLRWGRLYRDGQ